MKEMQWGVIRIVRITFEFLQCIPTTVKMGTRLQVILNIEDGTCTQAEDCEGSAKRPAARFAHAACAVQTESSQCVYFFGGVGQEADYQDFMSWTPSPSGGKDGVGL